MRNSVSMGRYGFVSLFSNLSLFLFIIFVHLGCFVLHAAGDNSSSLRRNRKASKRRKSATSLSLLNPPHKSISSSLSYLKSYFTKKNPRPDRSVAAAAAASSHRSLPSPDPFLYTSDNQENSNIIPCTACGEIFPKRQLLERHIAMKHAVSELSGDDSGHNIVKIIFNTNWTNKNPKIHRILKIHNSPKVLSWFEDYREVIKSKAAARIRARGGGWRSDERCIADGNELLRFHCSTFMCDLGQDGNSALCNQQFCSVCEIIRSGFSAKLDGVSTMSTSWKAHVAIPDETIEEFRFMNVKRAMLICRVAAGRVGADGDEDGDGFDSVVVGPGRDGAGVDEEELLVLNPRAVLPCFVVVYTV